MTSHSSVLAGLLSAAVVVPWLAAGESSNGGADECQRSCGGVDIPYPFGMGTDGGCWLNERFRLSCQDDGTGQLKPFMVTADSYVGREVRNISLERGEAQVTNPISYYCYDTGSSLRMKNDVWNLRDTPYSFSSTANKFTVVGCRALAYVGDTKNTSAMYQTGCVALCFQGNMDLSSCSGMGCKS